MGGAEEEEEVALEGVEVMLVSKGHSPLSRKRSRRAGPVGGKACA